MPLKASTAVHRLCSSAKTNPPSPARRTPWEGAATMGAVSVTGSVTADRVTHRPGLLQHCPNRPRTDSGFDSGISEAGRKNGSTVSIARLAHFLLARCNLSLVASLLRGE